MSEYFDVEGLEYTWAVDDDESPAALEALATKFEKYGRFLDDMTPVLVGAHQIMSDDIREHFLKEEGPTEPWADWAPSYAPRAYSENVGILRKTEELFETATSDSAWFIMENDLWYNPNDLPPYWYVQQEGRAGMPARPFLWTSDEARERVIELFEAWAGYGMDIVISTHGVAQPHTPLFGPRIGLGSIFPTV